MRSLLMLPVLAAAILVDPAAAQTPETEVLQVVERVFEGMRTADTTMMRSTFHPEARLVSTTYQDGEPVVRMLDPSVWLQGVAGSEEVLDERLFDPVVQVADNLATVWVYYTLHIGDRFSHCGYDAFQLVRTAEGWKITQVADTRQRQGCHHTERP